MKKEMQLGEADQAYIKIKNELHEKDGNVHVVMGDNRY